MAKHADGYDFNNLDSAYFQGRISVLLGSAQTVNVLQSFASAMGRELQETALMRSCMSAINVHEWRTRMWQLAVCLLYASCFVVTAGAETLKETLGL